MLSYYKKKIKIKGDNMMRYKKIVALGITIAVAGLSGCNQSTKLENMESISTNTEDKSEYFPGKFFASNTSGYYYWGYTDYMTFYDLNTKKSVLLCNKPDCNSNCSFSVIYIVVMINTIICHTAIISF